MRLGAEAKTLVALQVACGVAAAAWELVAGSSSLGETAFVRLLRLATVTAALSLAVQLLIQFVGLEEPFGTVQPDNKDPTLIFREEQGVTRLVPLVPKRDRPQAKFTMEEVSQHATKDDCWIVVDGLAYDVTRYLDKHPGGSLPMENMAGKDCTDVFANYHADKVYKVILPAFCVGEVTDFEVFPHVVDFRRIRQELLRRGLFETDMRFYWKHGTFEATLFLGALYLTIGGASFAARMAGATLMGIFWQQLAGIGHDLGHSGVSHSFLFDHLVGSCMASLMGLSTCWWKRNHNTHHVVCNSVEHDPDIQHMPILAVTPRVFEKPFWSTYYRKVVAMDPVARFLIGYQHIVFYPMMAVARFNLYVQSWIQLCSREPLHYRKVEIVAMSVYAFWVLKLALSLPTWRDTVAWFLVSHAVAGLLHVQIVISHWAMETYHGHAYNDDSDEWYITQLKTTMNVDTPPMLDFVHIGLQFQIEHHLYPRLPRHNLRHARELVQQVCKKHSFNYQEYGFFEANFRTLQALYQTALTAGQTTKGSSGFYESALCSGLNLVG